MRHLLTLALLITLPSFYSQTDFCAINRAQARWFAAHPELKTRFESLRRQKKQALEAFRDQAPAGGAQASAAPSFTIPVVFHILHMGGSENITDAQVRDAVNILTRDFNRMNADTANVVSAFKKVIGDAQIHFQLASVDPMGNCTNGIIRYQDVNTDWTGDFDEYAYSWPNDQYLNIYVVKTINIGQSAAAYAYLPDMLISPEMDAIVTMSHYVGSIGTGAIGRSRVLTHEVGHWLGLEHVWGWNDVGVSCGDDGIWDTPETKGYKSCSLTNNDICNPGYPENVQNYMDYSYCSNMFTIGQAMAMKNTLNGWAQNRKNLSSASNLAFTLGQGPSCLTKLEIGPFPTATVCSGGTLAMVSYTSNFDPSVLTWSAPNAIVMSPGTGSTIIQFTSTGQFVVTCSATTNDGVSFKSTTVKVVDGSSEAGAFSESFETDGQLPEKWKSLYASSAHQWEQNTDAASEGIYSMMIRGEIFPAGRRAILETSSYDLKNTPGAIFSFKYAYARKHSSHRDEFKVQASTDCGGTWKDIYLPGAASLAQNSGGIVSTGTFFPEEHQWKLYILSSHPNYKIVTKEPNVRFRFVFTEDSNAFSGGNRFYLDEINMTSTVTAAGMRELENKYDLSVFPNPSDGAINLAYDLPEEKDISYTFISSTGVVLESGAMMRQQAGAHSIRFNGASQHPKGLYFATLEINGVRLCKKVVID